MVEVPKLLKTNMFIYSDHVTFMGVRINLKLDDNQKLK